MFVVQALFPFSSVVMQQQKQQTSQNQTKQIIEKQNNNQLHKAQSEQNQKPLAKLQVQSEQKDLNNSQNNNENVSKNQSPTKVEDSVKIVYLKFEQGDKILVIEAYQNGWWYGHTIKQPDIQGYFPSNYVKIASQMQKPKPPPPPPQQMPQYDYQDLPIQQVDDKNNQDNADWVKNQLKNITKGPIQSAYYLGITGYKNVKIGQNNQNILKGDHVKFDVSTGLAKVPIKNQAPAAKAVRQMGYYFDYHQWCQQRNVHPQHRSRPDPKKKKIKKLNLKGMK